MTAVLEAQGLELPGRLARCDLQVEAGELVCLVGPNGSGKTSLLHGIAGIGNPIGRVRIAATDPAASSPDARKRLLAYLPASRDVHWPIIASDLIRLGLPSGAADVADVLDALDLTALAGRRVDRLSTGERSRVLIARALAPSPRLLLLDEPASNLDPKWQLRLMDHLRGIAGGEGRAVIAAVHDLDLAARYADRIIVMDGGAIAADGAPADILNGPHIPAIFGIARSAAGWSLVSPSADPRSSR
jgi:iron complex transport system ATP-binding protein